MMGPPSRFCFLAPALPTCIPTASQQWHMRFLSIPSQCFDLHALRCLCEFAQAGVKNTRTTEFFQGRTVRWGLAWSFTSEGMIGDKVEK